MVEVGGWLLVAGRRSRLPPASSDYDYGQRYGAARYEVLDKHLYKLFLICIKLYQGQGVV